MFLALKEIRHEKLRYSLIVLLIFLISYLIFMLSSLAIGLADENTVAIESWKTKSVILNKNSNLSLNQSLLTNKDLENLKTDDQTALVGQIGLVVKKSGRKTVNTQFIGLDEQQYIYQDLKLVSGKKAQGDNEVMLDASMKDKGYRIGDQLKLNDLDHKVKVTAFVKNAKINIAPIIYGTLNTWKQLRHASPDAVASGVILKKKVNYNHENAESYGVKNFIKKLPGYEAQNLTFEMMIGFLLVISLIIIGIFLYILTMQKLPNFAVLRAQGISSKTLIASVVWQAAILIVVGVAIGLIMMELTMMSMPSAVPMSFTISTKLMGSIGMLVMGLIGSLLPVRSILKVDPAQAIGA
ncbi:MAG: ABC transporter permease [Lactobacillus sp.]|nr:ABC transporter permease [Lactobacillus sp.]